ncbi:MAG: hypothetical protein K8S00_06065 [Bacteroidales bacterium]|nr:hypothetical protein [Bacteroidales bacterium]
MYKYVFIKGTLEKVKVGSSTMENYIHKGYKFYSSPEEAHNSGIIEGSFKSKSAFKANPFNAHLSNKHRGKFN